VNEHDIRFMEHALGLACKGVGLASPNPMVGCVIVRDGQIVGEGFHQYDWRDHAEIVALKSAGNRARGATLYVNLEPCNHVGRTGPCTEAILEAGVHRVVASIEDPNPLNSGRGFARLREAGLDVVTAVCEEKARRLNEAFACWIRTQKPFVTLKAALTLDGQLALPEASKKFAGPRSRYRRRNWITSEESRAEVHRLRHAADALLTGIGTIKMDDPYLTDRSGLPRRRPLLRVVLDSTLALSKQSRIVKSADHDLLIMTRDGNVKPRGRSDFRRIAMELCSVRKQGRHLDLEGVLKELGRRDLLSVLLEAGPTLNGAALEAGVVDKLFLFYAPKISGASRVPLALAPRLHLPALQNVRTYQFGGDIAIEAYLHDAYKK